MKKVLLAGLVWLVGYTAPCYAAEPQILIHSTAYEATRVLTTDPTKALYWVTITWKTQANRWLIVYDSATVPVDGVLSGPLVMYCGVVSLATDAAQGTRSFDFTSHPLPKTTNGTTVIISTNGAGCATKTADGANNWLSAGIY